MEVAKQIVRSVLKTRERLKIFLAITQLCLKIIPKLLDKKDPISISLKRFTLFLGWGMLGVSLVLRELFSLRTTFSSPNYNHHAVEHCSSEYRHKYSLK
jgi:hypothetical protein